MSSTPLDTPDAALGDDAITDFGLLVEAHRRLTREFDRRLRASHRISGTVFEALLRVGRSPDKRLPTCELARQLGVTSGGATRIVDRLSTDGYVHRTDCPADRRVQYIELTERGLETLAAALEVHVADLQSEMVDRLTPDERTALRGALDKLR